MFLSNQHVGGIPSVLETETCALIRSASYCVRIQQGAGIAPSHPGPHLPRNRDTALATDSIILIVHLCMGDML
jgi:hypothetical protein